MEGPHIDHCRVVSWMKFNNLADYEKAMSRLRSLPESLQQIQQLLQIGVDEGRVPSVVSTVRAVVDCRKLYSTMLGVLCQLFHSFWDISMNFSKMWFTIIASVDCIQ